MSGSEGVDRLSSSARAATSVPPDFIYLFFYLFFYFILNLFFNDDPAAAHRLAAPPRPSFFHSLNTDLTVQSYCTLPTPTAPYMEDPKSPRAGTGGPEGNTTYECQAGCERSNCSHLIRAGTRLSCDRFCDFDWRLEVI